MKKCFSLVLLLALLLVGCVEEQQPTVSLPDYSDPIASYDTESYLNPDHEGSMEETSVGGESNQNGFSVKYKKYEYQGNDLVIILVENKTEKHYSVTVNGYYLNDDGSVMQTETKSFEGFAAGFSNYFIFSPGTQFDNFDYTMDFQLFEEDPAAKYMVMSGVTLDCRKWRGIEGELPDYYVGVSSNFYIAHTYNASLYFGADFLVLDKNDNIFFVDQQLVQKDISPLKEGQDIKARSTERFMFYDENVLWENVDEYVLPDELNGEITGIVAFKWIDYRGKIQ